MSRVATSNGATVVDGEVVDGVVADVVVDVDVDVGADDVEALELLVVGSDVVVAGVVDVRPASTSSCSNWLSARSWAREYSMPGPHNW